MKQHEAVISTLEKLGGVATLGQLNQEVFKIKECNWGTKTPFASIRRIVQKNKEIYKIKPGLYGLLKSKNEIENRGIILETINNKTSKEYIEFNHSYYQGLLLIIGKLRKLDTFIPNQDKNKLFIDNRRLCDIRTLQEMPIYSYSEMVRKCPIHFLR
jgi:hypothetical protein